MTFIAWACSVNHTFAVKRGSVPPSPLGTNSSQYLAILNKEYLSISLAFIYSPHPYRLLLTIS